MGVQGLADGFLAGFQTADGAITRDKELTLRDASLQHQIKDSDRTYSLREADQNYRFKADERDFVYKKGRDDVGDQQWSQKLGLEKQQLGLSAARYNLQKKEFDFQIKAKEEAMLREREAPLVQAFYNSYETTGEFPQHILSQISESNPLHPKRFIGEKAMATVRELNQVMPKVLNGEMNYNDPQVHKVLGTILEPRLNRGIGEKDPQTGKEITKKELSHIGIAEDGKNLLLGVKVTYKDGSTAEKPVTEFGSADVNDKNLAYIPIQRVMEEARGYSQMAGALNQPGGDPLRFIAEQVNPKAKGQSGELKEYRSALLDVDKDEAKQMAELNKDGAMLDEAQKAAAVKAIQEGANQRRERVGQLFGVGTDPNNDSTSGGVPPAVKQWAGDDPDKNQVMSELQARGLFKGQNPTPQQLDSVYAGFVQKRGGQKSEGQSAKLPEYGSVAPLNKTPSAINNNYGQMNFGTMDLDTISGMRDQIHAYKNELEQTELIHLRARLQQGRKMNEGDKAKSAYLTAMIEDVEEELGNRGPSLKGLRDIGPKVDTSLYQDSYEPQRYRLRDAGK